MKAGEKERKEKLGGKGGGTGRGEKMGRVWSRKEGERKERRDGRTREGR